MPIPPGTTSGIQIIQNVTRSLVNLRDAYQETEYLESWLSELVVADLEGQGIDPVTSQQILNAIADAHGEYMLRTTGSDPRNVGPGYDYAASQIALIGPQT